MLLGIPRSARCVQRFDDSLNSAIHITYRISLRSSSMREPRDPLLKVVYRCVTSQYTFCYFIEFVINAGTDMLRKPGKERASQSEAHSKCTGVEWMSRACTCLGRPATTRSKLDNDPSAGSPTETLLRLLLPLNDQV